jgi:hypothetical protein
MDFVSNIFQNIFTFIRFLFLEQLSCRKKPYEELYDNELDNIESNNFNKMER